MGSDNGKSKFRRETGQPRPSDRLRREKEPPTDGGQAPDESAPDTSGQVGPKSRAGKKAAKEARRTDKSKFRAEKSADKLTAAKEKRAAQKPQRPPGAAKTLTRAAGYEVWAKVHGKIHEVERENVGTEAAHRTELSGEKAGRAVTRYAKRRIRDRPARQVVKRERKSVRAAADYRFRQTAAGNPGPESNPVNRFLQKRRLKKQYQKQLKEAARKSATKVGEAAASGIEKIGRAAVNFIGRHPAGELMALLCFLPIAILQSCVGGALAVGSGLAGAVGGTSYLAEDADIDEAELRYTEWETDLTIRANNAASTHPGYDEYRFSIDRTGHDPYAIPAYLTAKHDDFTFAEIRGELQSIFDRQYTLDFTRIVEVRSYTESGTDADGNSYSYTVYYNHYILQTTLTARSFEGVISPLLTTRDERERYAVYMLLRGNRQFVGSPFAFDWLPCVSSRYGYRVHPISGEKDYHTGVDIAVPAVTEILAGGAGMVVSAGNGGSYGLTLLVDYGEGISARYAHCSALLAGAGRSVTPGDVIALSGDTGAGTGPHLHFEVMENGEYRNPLYFAVIP